MYKNKIDNMNNLSGIAIRNLRIEKGWSQRELADALQLLGLDLDKNAIQRIEARKRFVTDIEYYDNLWYLWIGSLVFQIMRFLWPLGGILSIFFWK